FFFFLRSFFFFFFFFFAVAESFFQLLKRERIKEKIYGTRDEARSDIFDYIEMFYNSRRRHGSSEQMPPAEYENLYHQRLRSVQVIRGDSQICSPCT
ncbi:IS3 family transposase, partial [Salmonella enterica]